MRKVSSEDIKGIKQSLIASFIFVILLEPIIQIGKNLSKGIIAALIDYFYYSCSHTSWGSSIGYCAFLAFTFCSVKAIGDSIPDAFPSKDQKLKNTDTQSKTETPTSNSLEKDIAITAASLNELQQREKKLKRLDKMCKWLSRFNIAIQILFLIYILLYQFSAAAMNESFDRRITQIAPYVSVQRVEMIKSNWIQMETKGDYEEIVQEIDEILNENNLK